MKSKDSPEIIELVVYKIKPHMKSQYINSAIETFRQLVMTFEGFISYEFYQGCRESDIFMDLVRWSSIEYAEAAAKQVKIVQQSPEYVAYLEAFESLEIFNHFTELKTWR